MPKVIKSKNIVFDRHGNNNSTVQTPAVMKIESERLLSLHKALAPWLETTRPARNAHIGKHVLLKKMLYLSKNGNTTI